MKKNHRIRTTIYLSALFIIFFFSYSTNFLGIAAKYYTTFDRSDEMFVIGRLDAATYQGILSYGGLPGSAHPTRDSIAKMNYDYMKEVNEKYDYYLTDQKMPGDKFAAYYSQSGGQGLFYSVLQKILPFKNEVKIRIYRAINICLLAFCFILFLGWCYRNYGLLSSFITFVLLLFSPIVHNFAFSLWWTLWSYYIPFLTMLLILERNNKSPGRYPEHKTLVFLFISVFAKCFFTGFEYITPTLAAILCPIIYYHILEGKRIKTTFIFICKTITCSVTAILAEVFLLINQIKSIEGSYAKGIEYLIHAFTRRSSLDVDEFPPTIPEILNEHLFGMDLVIWGHSAYNITLTLFTTILIVLIMCISLYFLSKKIDTTNKSKSKALLVTTLLSSLAPISWIVIFTEHVSKHSLDRIIWYMPFLLYGFLVIGVCFSIILSRLRRKNI